MVRGYRFLRDWVLLLVLASSLISCSGEKENLLKVEPDMLPTVIIPAATVVVPTASLVAAPVSPTPPATATLVPTVTNTATAVPPTNTPLPTATIVIPPTATATPPPAGRGGGSCRSMAELPDLPPQPDIWNGERPAASPEIVHVGSGGPHENWIHLGFDVEGNSTVALRELLDVLDKHNIKVTMFIVGNWAEQLPHLIVEMDERGHELVNHTYSHPNMKPLSAEEVLLELEKTEQLIYDLTGKSSKPWIRPPFGSRSELSVQTAYEAGWTTVIWTGGSEDWRPDATAETMCNSLMQASSVGGILYSHTYHPELPAAIDNYITDLRHRGYQFVPLSMMFVGRGRR